MPFTLSHVAAVLPLLPRTRSRLEAAALIAGSMAPDVPFYAESLARGSYRLGGLTHRWWAVPTLDVAITAVLVAAWEGLLREPLTGRAEAEAKVDPLRLAAAAALGAASHVGWDAFTHADRAGVRAFPALNRRVAGQPLYHLLQYGSSLLGLACLATRPQPKPSGAVTTALTVGAVAGAAHRLARHERGPLDELCFGAGAGAALGAVGYALAARLPRRATLSPARAGSVPRSAPSAPAPAGPRSR